MKTLYPFVVVLSIITSCNNNQTKYPNVAAPVALVKAHEITSKHGDKRADNYFG